MEDRMTSYGYIPFLFGLAKIEAFFAKGEWHIEKCHRCNSRFEVTPENHYSPHYTDIYQNFFREKAKKTEYWQDLILQFYKNKDEKQKQLRLI